MWQRLLPLVWLVLLSRSSFALQQAIIVPFDQEIEAGSPIEVTGKVSVRETVAGNQVDSSWEENVLAKNISHKSILLLVGLFDAIGPYSNGGYEFREDRFFSREVLRPGDTISVASTEQGPTERSECCINPLDEPREPKSDFRILFVQFIDGSTFGNRADAEDALASRRSSIRALRKLARTYSEEGEEKFRAQLEDQHDLTFIWIRKREKEQGIKGAIALVRQMLALGEQRYRAIGEPGTK